MEPGDMMKSTQAADRRGDGWRSCSSSFWVLPFWI